MRNTAVVLLAFILSACGGETAEPLAVPPPVFAGGPPIKTQQCSVAPLLPASFSMPHRLYVANRTNIITGYSGLAANTSGYLIGSPDQVIGGSNTQLSLVSKNYLAGMARDAAGRLYIAGANTNTVTVYAPPSPGSSNPLPIGALSAVNGLSQPGGLAFDAVNSLLYVANTGNGTITVYQVTAGGSVTFLRKATITGLSAPLGLALNGDGTRLYVANRGSNSIGYYTVGTGPSFTPVSLASLQDLTGPIGIALSPEGNRLYVANNGKINNWYSVTIYAIDASGKPTPTAVHIGGDQTGLCNPAAVAVETDPSGAKYLYVANRESSGGSLTVYNLNPDGSLRVPAGAPAEFNVQPAAMMLHDTVNQLGAPVGLLVSP